MTQKYHHQAAGILLIDAQGNIVAQLRDDKPTINQPGKVSLFGGVMEAGETPLQGVMRELAEETNLKFSADQLKPFMSYVTHATLPGNWPYLLHVFIARDLDTTDMEVYEGQGTYIVTRPDDPLIASDAYPAFSRWFTIK